MRYVIKHPDIGIPALIAFSTLSGCWKEVLPKSRGPWGYLHEFVRMIEEDVPSLESKYQMGSPTRVADTLQSPRG
jgi:hypothetical protein